MQGKQHKEQAKRVTESIATIFPFIKQYAGKYLNTKEPNGIKSAVLRKKSKG